MKVKIGNRWVGDGEPCYVVAEIGANHNGDVGLAAHLFEAAKTAGADAVKTQKRVPALCVPPDMQGHMKDTPWGRMTYLAYRERLEFQTAEYLALDLVSRRIALPWFASCWDPPSLEFIMRYDPPAIKIASACVTDLELLRLHAQTSKPLIMSVGMSTTKEIDRAFAALAVSGSPDNIVLLWCRSTYPADPETLNLAAMTTLRERYRVPVGFSDHHVGLWMSLCAVAMGAAMIERHFTLNRSMWGTDQAASVEPAGLTKLISQIRRFESARGDGRLGPLPAEIEVAKRLRRVQG